MGLPEMNKGELVMTKKTISFKSQNITMAGDLYYPANMTEGRKLPTIVCVHPAGAVKEQSVGLYAGMLADNGFAALAFDASNQGASGGEPRWLEDPAVHVEDIRSAIDYLTTLPFVDADRIGALGICAGGGYSISTAQTERCIKAVAGISITDPGVAIREGWDGTSPVSEQITMLKAVAR
jgi:uncharacterized protein